MKITIPTSDIEPILKDYLPANQWPFFRGSPGIGKSQIVNETVRKLYPKNPVFDIRMSLLELIETQGLPHIKNGVTKFARPQFLPEIKNAILILDEITSVKPANQVALYQLCDSGRIGEHKLGEGYKIILLGNCEDDNAVVYPFSTAFEDRIREFHVRIDVNHFLEYAQKVGMPAEMQAFITWQKEKVLHTLKKNEDSDDVGFATPRSWIELSSLINSLKNKSIYDVSISYVASFLGKLTALQLSAFLKVIKDINLKEIFNSPATAPLMTTEENCYAICNLLIKKADLHNISAIDTYTKRIGSSQTYNKLVIETIAKNNPEIADSEFYQQWSISNA